MNFSIELPTQLWPLSLFSPAEWRQFLKTGKRESFYLSQGLTQHWGLVASETSCSPVCGGPSGSPCAIGLSHGAQGGESSDPPVYLNSNMKIRHQETFQVVERRGQIGDWISISGPRDRVDPLYCIQLSWNSSGCTWSWGEQSMGIPKCPSAFLNKSLEGEERLLWI